MTVAGQPLVSYTYDDADRLMQITQGSSVVTFGHDNADRRTSLTLPNGVLVEYSFDSTSKLTGITYKLGVATLGGLTYDYDLAGRRVQVNGSFARTGLPQPVASAAYDAANEMLRWGTNSLAYDANGNLTSDGASTYAWDARNRLAAITGGASASFFYDALNRRATKGSTSYLYDGANVVQELSGTTPTANLLSGGIDEVFTRTDSAGSRYFLNGGLGSTEALTDASGSILTQYTYDPFGNTTVTGAASTNPFQYTGRENDGTGLYYYRARYYSPHLQRFISEDPLGFGADSVNFYDYVGNSPSNFTDPFGLQALPPGCSPPFATRCGPPLYDDPDGTPPPTPRPPPPPIDWDRLDPQPNPQPQPWPRRPLKPLDGRKDADKKDDDDDDCWSRYQREDAQCKKWYPYGTGRENQENWFKCKDRAYWRYRACLSGNPEAPGPLDPREWPEGDER
jgi:RHS repeat-associated protein